MKDSHFFVVTEDQNVVMKAKQFAEHNGMEMTVVSPTDWNQQVRGSNFQVGTNATVQSIPSLSAGENQVVKNFSETPEEVVGGKILHFPTPVVAEDPSVTSINDLESQAIENAINVYRGNLTEAAKALGIGRATLYRKVKQYNINPQEARRKRAA